MRGDELMDDVRRGEPMDALDARLRAALVVEPPAELQAQLAAIVQTAAAERRTALGARPRLAWLTDPSTWVAAAALALAIWQAFQWLASSTLVLGDVGDAAALLAALPALPSLADLGFDPLGAALWLVVGIVAWLVAEGTPLRRRGRPHSV